MKPLCTLLFFFGYILPMSGQSIRYVKQVASGSGNGTSWANSSSNIQAMLDIPGVDEVWVAAGTYKPSAYPTGCSNCISSRDYAFRIPADKKLIGGFAGTESAINQRNLSTHTTILSGDVGAIGVVTDNTYHVVVAPFLFEDDFMIELDGLTITDGYSDGSTSSVIVDGINIYRNEGAGACFIYGSKTIKNCTFQNNRSFELGGGLFSINKSNAALSIKNCNFNSNQAKLGGAIISYFGNTEIEESTLTQNVADTLGGAIFIRGEFTINNTTLSNNQAKQGGGLFAFICFPKGTITNSQILNNTATINGGGVQTYLGNYDFLSNNFNGNVSVHGGGAYIYEGTNIFKNNVFQMNQASNFSGGGVALIQTDNNILEKNFFIENHGQTGGGIGVSGSTGNTQVSNNFFLSNTSGFYGGGVILFSGTNTLFNNTFVDNSSPNFGGGAIFTNGGTNAINNNILWANKKGTSTTSSGADYRNFDGTNTFQNNAMQLSSTSYTTTATGDFHLGTGSSANKFAVNPLFVNDTNFDGPDNIFGTNDDGGNLQATSTLVNMGLSMGAPTQDIRSLGRIGIPDIGAYEYIANLCPETLTFSGNITMNGSANTSIVTSGTTTLPINSNTTFQAGNFIQLNPGFSTGSNAVFLTKLVSGCQ